VVASGSEATTVIVAESPSSIGPLLVTLLMIGEMLGGWPTFTRPPSTPAEKSK